MHHCCVGGSSGRRSYRSATDTTGTRRARSPYYRTELRKKKPSGRDRHSSVLGRGVDLDARICDGWAWASLGIGRLGLILEYSHIHA